MIVPVDDCRGASTCAMPPGNLDTWLDIWHLPTASVPKSPEFGRRRRRGENPIADCLHCPVVPSAVPYWSRRPPQLPVSESSSRGNKGDDLSVKLLADVRHQGHEASSLDGLGDGVLAGGRATRLATSNDTAVAVDQLFQEVNILVVHVHGTRALAIYVQRIAFGSASTCFCFCSSAGSSAYHVLLSG